MEVQFGYLDINGVNYAKSIFDPIITPIKDKNGGMQISFSSEVKGLDIFYTFDGTLPDNFSPKYKQIPISTPSGATEVWAITFRNGKPVGKLLSIDIKELQRRLTLK